MIVAARKSISHRRGEWHKWTQTHNLLKWPTNSVDSLIKDLLQIFLLYANFLLLFDYEKKRLLTRVP